ncbi:MAG: J domain-containing protein [Myxococcota bacterium]
MALERSQRIAVKPRAPGAKLDIGPQDYFVLSRVEGGTPTVGEVIDVTGLPSAQTQEILGRLLELGALELSDGGGRPKPAPTASSPQANDRLRARAAERRRKTLARGFGGGPSHDKPTREMNPVNHPARETRETPKVDALPPPPPFVLPPVPGDDPRLDTSLAIDIEEQRSLLAMLDRGEELTAFEMLGLHPTHDKGEIRAAFRKASRRFHPDAYHGRDLGPFSDRLGRLFAAAKDAVKKLGDEDYRGPLVETYEAGREKVRLEEETRRNRMQAAKAAAEEIRNKRDREEVDARRKARMRDRAQAQRGRVIANLAGRVKQHIADAEKAERLGNLPAAANHYRLALRVDPNMPDVKAKWEKVRSTARRERAKEAFSRANSYLELGQSSEALPLLVEAADADPTLEHLAHAADLLRSVDAARARELAMQALNALNRDDKDQKGRPRSGAALAELHLMIGRAFLDAGQKKTAKAQAEAAQELAPDNPQVRALLKSIKVK